MYSLIYIVLRIILGESFTLLQLMKTLVFGASTQFYYIVVLCYFILITPFLVRHRSSTLMTVCICLCSAMLLAAIYFAEAKGLSGCSYYFKYTPIWICFYYFGIKAKEDKIPPVKMNLVPILLLICVGAEITESYILKKTVILENLAYSQMRITAYVYATSLIYGLFTLKEHYVGKLDNCVIGRAFKYIGDRSFALFWIHHLYLRLFNAVFAEIPWCCLPFTRFVQFVFMLICSLVTIEIIKKVCKSESFRTLLGI